MRLLVAVSNEPLAHAIHGALLAGRHEVSLASTGSIALAAVAKESFDAVILDESLLGISTEQLIESLRNARASVKILLLTSTPLSKTIGEGSRCERCLTSTPLSKRRPTAPSARIHAQTTQMPKPNNARTMLPLAHKLTYDAQMSC